MRNLTPLVTLVLLTSAHAQAHRPTPKPGPAPAGSQLPITRVALYKNGVGFFEHTGQVTGDQAVTIDFTSAQLNDVLQSLTAIDLSGGRISGAGYNSTTPLEQQLKSLPLALSTDPTEVDFYNAIRGARVKVTAPGISVTGRLLSIDLRTSPQSLSSFREAGESASSLAFPPTPPLPAPTRRFLTVVSQSGTVRTVELTPATSVVLLDTALHTDVTRYLELLANTRNQGLRHLTLLDRAPKGSTGARTLRISYISEVPVWKSTYRILFTDRPNPPGTPPQTSPSSETQSTSSTPPRGHLDRSEAQRRDPRIAPVPAEVATLSDQNAGTPPHTSPSSEAGSSTATLQGWSVIDNTTGSDWIDVHLDLIAGAPQSFLQPLSTPYYARRPEIPLPAEAQLTPQTHESGDTTEIIKEDGAPPPQVANVVGMAGMAGGSAGGVLGGIPQGMGSAPAPVTKAAPINYSDAANHSLAPKTTTAAFDDFFEYSLTDPITLRKNESALVPILQTQLPIERVTLWSVQQPVALRALQLTNTSNLTLDRGSFSIVEDGNFGGEGLLDPIHPGEKRLLSYAADQAVRVTPSAVHGNSRVHRLQVSKGVLTETSIEVDQRTYDLRNAAPQPRTVILEYPVRQGWELTGPNGQGEPETRPTETTPNAYRFRIPVAAAQTGHLRLAERHTLFSAFRLVDIAEDQLLVLLRDAKAGPATLAALQPVFDAHHAVLALDEQIRSHEAEVAAIATDQTRLRENMKALKGSPEEKALLNRYTGELNAQEDRLNTLNQQLASLRTQRTAADQDFQNKLQSLHLDEAL